MKLIPAVQRIRKNDSSKAQAQRGRAKSEIAQPNQSVLCELSNWTGWVGVGLIFLGWFWRTFAMGLAALLPLAWFGLTLGLVWTGLG